MASINPTRLLIILLTILVTVVLAGIVFWVALHFIADLLLLAVAVILAYLLHPPVVFVQSRLRVPRPVAILLLYLATGAALTLLGYLFIPPMADQARVLQARLPALLHGLNVSSSGLEQALRQHGITLPVSNVTGNAAGAIGAVGPGVLGGVLGLAASVGSTLLDIGLVLVMTFYLINDRASIGGLMSGLVPRRYAAGIAFATRSAGEIMGRYVRAQLAVAAMVGLLGGVGAAVLGVEYAPLIGLFAFLAESIPVLGPIIATVPAVLIALLEQPWPWRALAVLVWFIVVQQLEQNVIMPRLSGHAVGIHPVAAIMAVLIGFSVGSVWGAVFAVPLVGFAVALVREAWRVYNAGDTPTAEETEFPLPGAMADDPDGAAVGWAGRPVEKVSR